MVKDRDNDKTILKGETAQVSPKAEAGPLPFLRYPDGKIGPNGPKPFLRSPIKPQQDEEAQSFDQDISRIANGHKQIRQDALSVNRQTTGQRGEQARQAQHQQRGQSQAQRELANLEAWNAQMTTVGGVRMTNGEAQKARQGVIDNADRYAKWAVQQGLIRPGEEDKFKQTAQRKHELEDKRGRGTITPEEEKEAQRIAQSREGKALDAATAYEHQHDGVRPALHSASGVTRTSPITPAASMPVQDPSSLKSVFAAAHAGPTEEEQRNPPAPTPLSPKVSATGLTL